MATENAPISKLPPADPLTGLEPIPTVQGDETLSPSSVTDTYVEKTTVTTTPTDIATYVGTVVPPAGTITMYAGSKAPTGWLICDGSLLQSSEKYGKLYAVIGTTFTGNESGAGANKFRIPDMQGKVAVGFSATAYGGKLKTIGVTGGEYDHTLILNEMPSHSHSYSDRSINGFNEKDAKAGDSDTNFVQIKEKPWNDSSKTTGATGKGQSHNNMPPYIVLNYIIKY